MSVGLSELRPELSYKTLEAESDFDLKLAIDKWFEDLSYYETTLEQMSVAKMDSSFNEELQAIEQWFNVLSEAEQTAALFSLTQSLSRVQVRFFTTVLKQMTRKMDSLLSTPTESIPIPNPLKSSVSSDFIPKYRQPEEEYHLSVQKNRRQFDRHSAPISDEQYLALLDELKPPNLGLRRASGNFEQPRGTGEYYKARSVSSSAYRPHSQDMESLWGSNLGTIHERDGSSPVLPRPPLHRSMSGNIPNYRQPVGLSKPPMPMSEPNPIGYGFDPSLQNVGNGQNLNGQSGQGNGMPNGYVGSNRPRGSLPTQPSSNSNILSTNRKIEKSPILPCASLSSSLPRSESADETSESESRKDKGKIPDAVDPAVVQDIPVWLRSLRLHKYTPLFEKDHWMTMIKMSDDDLLERGVVALGARRKMLKVFEFVKADLEAKGVAF